MSTTSTTASRAVRWVALFAILAVIGFLVVLKLDLFGDGDGKGGTEPGTGAGGGHAPAPPKVGVYVVERGRLDAPLTLAGTVLPNEHVNITSEVAGMITGLSFSEGTHVAAGTLLAKLNDRELQASLSRAKSRKKFARQNQIRKKALLDRNGISPAEYEAAVNELETATAEMELIEAQIAKTEIRAPFGGVVGLREVSLGSYVTPSTVIATLQDIDPLKVEFNIPEGYAASVRPGMVFNFTVEGSSAVRTAKVYATEPGLDTRTRSLRVRAVSRNPGGALLPGQYAAVELNTGSSNPQPLVPTESIVPTMNGQQLFVVSDGKSVARAVKTGSRSEQYIEILEGVSVGDSVIVSGLQAVRDGGPVQPIGG